MRLFYILLSAVSARSYFWPLVKRRSASCFIAPAKARPYILIHTGASSRVIAASRRANERPLHAIRD
jgi:hypothetical protein